MNLGFVAWALVGPLVLAPAPTPESTPADVPAVEDSDAAGQPVPSDPTIAPAPDTAVAEDQTVADHSEPVVEAPAAVLPPEPRVQRDDLEIPRGARIGYAVAGSVVLAGAGTMLGLMGYYIARSRSLEREGEDRVGSDASRVQGSSLQDLVASGEKANRLAVTMGVLGGVALGGAIGLIWLAARRPRNVGVTASVGRGGAGLSWTRRF